MLIPKLKDLGNTFFTPIFHDIIHILKENEILMCEDRKLRTPSQLMYIPTIFRDSNGDPILKPYPQKAYVLSKAYNITDLNILKVRELDFAGFVNHLLYYLHTHADIFKRQVNSWHEALSKALVSHMARNAQWKTWLKIMDIIPLSDRISWVSGADGNVFLPHTSDSQKIPGGIDTKFVDPEACQNPYRKQLYQSLDVRSLDSKEVCKLILKKHESMTIETCRHLESDAIISHAQYLCLNSSISIGKFWLLDQHGAPSYRGEDLYIDLPERGRSIASYYAEDPSKIRLIHPDYMISLDDSTKSQFIMWLQNSLDVWRIPRLFIRGNGSEITSEFKYLMEERPISVFLTLLRDYWHTYSRYFEDADIFHSVLYAKRRKLLSEAIIRREPEMVLLKDTVLPLDELINKAGAREALNFLDILDPKDYRWTSFKCLNVTVAQDLSYYSKFLQGLSQKNSDDISLKDVCEVYEEIYFRCERNDDGSRSIR